MSELSEQEIIEARHWHGQSKGICVVAVIESDVGWEAFIGEDGGWREVAERKGFVALYGAKLSIEDAKYFFPDINLPYKSYR